MPPLVRRHCDENGHTDASVLVYVHSRRWRYSDRRWCGSGCGRDARQWREMKHTLKQRLLRLASRRRVRRGCRRTGGRRQRRNRYRTKLRPVVVRRLVFLVLWHPNIPDNGPFAQKTRRVWSDAMLLGNFWRHNISSCDRDANTSFSRTKDDVS